ncbi:MAG TPA: hypothetical protein VGD76_15095 [Ramlibacter sp.]
MKRALAFYRWARTWAIRWAIAFLIPTGFLPAPLLLEWLRWLRESMHPQHPGLPVVLREIAEVEDRCRA